MTGVVNESILQSYDGKTKEMVCSVAVKCVICFLAAGLNDCLYQCHETVTPRLKNNLCGLQLN